MGEYIAGDSPAATERESLCSAPACERPHRSKGYCNAHYIQWRKTGRVDKLVQERAPQGAPLSDRLEFHSMPLVESGCIVWLGSLSEGYGKIRVGGQSRYAHRVAYEQSCGAVPEGKVLDHRCGVRSCINVDHLRVASQAENIRHRTVMSSNNTSGHRGVYSAANDRWVAQVTVNGRSKHLGYFDSIDLAAKVAAEARRDHYGDFRGLV